MKKLHIVSVVTAAAFPVVFTLAPVSAGGQVQANTTAKGGPFPRQITLFDRSGKVLRTLGRPANYSRPVFSPDGTRLAVAHDGQIWVFDIATGTSTQVTSEPGAGQPAWSPDGSQIAFVSRRELTTQGNGLYRKASNGTGSEELLYRHSLAAQLVLTEWSPDGRFLSFYSGGVLYVLALAGERKAVELVREEYEAYGGRFSFDSRLLAYTSDESGQNEIYVRTFDPSSVRFSTADEKWQVSNLGGLGPLKCAGYEAGYRLEPCMAWRQDARELYYLTPDERVMAVEVTTIPAFKAGPPKLLFRMPGNGATASISRDGQRFVLAVLMPPERRVATIKPEILAKYTGTYIMPGNDQELEVTLEGTQLMLQSADTEKRPLFPESEVYFFRRDPTGDRDVEFIKDDKGAVTHFLMYFGGPGIKWTRQ